MGNAESKGIAINSRKPKENEKYVDREGRKVLLLLVLSRYKVAKKPCVTKEMLSYIGNGVLSVNSQSVVSRKKVLKNRYKIDTFQGIRSLF